MSCPKVYTYTMTASVANAVCAAQRPGGAGALTINGASASNGVATLNYPRHLLITTVADDSSKSLTITGTNRYGNVLSVTTTAPNNSTKIVPYNFNTVTRVTIDGAAAGNISIGTANSLEGPWIPLDWRGSHSATIAIGLSSAANLTYTVQSTLEDVQSSSFNAGTAVTQNTPLTGTASALYTLNGPLCAIRVQLSNWVTGSATLTILENVSGE